MPHGQYADFAYSYVGVSTVTSDKCERVQARKNGLQRVQVATNTLPHPPGLQVTNLSFTGGGRTLCSSRRDYQVPEKVSGNW